MSSMQHAAYNIYHGVGNRGFLNGEYGWELVRKITGTVHLDGDFTEDEREDGYDMKEATGYVFRKLVGSAGIDGEGEEVEWYQYNTRFYFGEINVFDFPNINEYHHTSEDEVDPNNWSIGGNYEESFVERAEENSVATV